MRGVARAVLALVLAASCAAAPTGGAGRAAASTGGAGPAAGDPLPLDVMSFNIRYGTAADGENHWDNRRDLVCDVIREHAPDVVGLQEALDFQIDYILEAVPGYAAVGEGREGGSSGEYSAILYRIGRFNVAGSGTFWLSDTPEVPSAHWGNACIRICTWGRFIERRSGRAFYLYNTHLDHESQPSREKSVRLAAERIAGRPHEDPFVLTGDFNAAEDNPAMKWLTGARGGEEATPVPLVDAYRVLHPDSRDVGTFNGFEGRTDGGKIDCVFVTPGTEVLHAAIVRVHSDGRYPSDHFPVTAEVLLPARPAAGQ